MKKNATTHGPTVAVPAGGPVTPDLVRLLLQDVSDPELGVNTVDLGLVYDVAAHEGGVHIRMTLTTPGCPLGGNLDDEVGRALGSYCTPRSRCARGGGPAADVRGRAPRTPESHSPHFTRKIFMKSRSATAGRV